MLDVNDLNRIVGDLVKELVRVSDEWNDANTGALFHFPRTLRPSPNPPLYCAKALFKRYIVG
jgi:hypothetical protein